MCPALPPCTKFVLDYVVEVIAVGRMGHNIYVLRHNEETDEWTLESFRSPASPGQYDPHFDPPDSIQ